MLARGIVEACLLGVLCAWPAAGASSPTPVAPKSPATAAAAGASSPAVAVSTAPAEPGVSDLYPAEKMHLRDPFVQGGASPGESFDDAEEAQFSIHDLTLKGILQDKSGDFALFSDQVSGSTYVLKRGVLYDAKNELVPGVSGIIKAKQKTVHLVAADKDVQTFILGEEGGTP